MWLQPTSCLCLPPPRKTEVRCAPSRTALPCARFEPYLARTNPSTAHVIETQNDILSNSRMLVALRSLSSLPLHPRSCSHPPKPGLAYASRAITMLAATTLAALFAGTTALTSVPNVGYVNGWKISDKTVRDTDQVRLSS